MQDALQEVGSDMNTLINMSVCMHKYARYGSRTPTRSRASRPTTAYTLTLRRARHATSGAPSSSRWPERADLDGTVHGAAAGGEDGGDAIVLGARVVRSPTSLRALVGRAVRLLAPRAPSRTPDGR